MTLRSFGSAERTKAIYENIFAYPCLIESLEGIEVTTDSLLAKLEDNKEIEGINELEIVSVVAVANPSWEEFETKAFIEVDGSGFTRNHG
jgi:hypothetical protein